VHQWHAAQKAQFAASDGWQVPLAYSGVEREIADARARLGIADVSAFAKVSLLGPKIGAVALALVGDGPTLRPLRVALLAAGNPVLACRLTEDHLLLLASTTSAAEIDQCLAARPPDPPVIQSDVTSAYAGFCLVGPRLEEVLRRVTPLDLGPASLPAGACAETSLAGVQALLVRAPEFSLPALRAYVSWDLGEYVWDRLLDAGRDHGLLPLGLEALRQLRQANPERAFTDTKNP
jgi:heterotetrameric sarcosine oxidase gamma subunit